MRVLFLCHRFPHPPKDGSRVRAFHLIKHLGATCEVTVGAPVRTSDEEAGIEALRGYCQRVLVGRVSAPAALARMILRLPTGTPSSMGYFYAPDLKRGIDAALAESAFDLIVVHCSSVAPYVAAVGTCPKILDFADMDSQKWLAYADVRGFPWSLGYRLEGRKLERAEARLAGAFDACTCITKAELDTLNGYGVETVAGWFPNGVDLDYFRPADEGYDPDRICFVGRMDYFPNQQGVTDFCHQVLPRIRERRPGVTFSIVGADPPAAIRKLGALPGVRVTGTVADVRPFVREAALTVAPLRIARGTQNKILESWAMGVPVVASSRAARGVDAVAGEHLLVADEPEAAAEAVLRLMADAGERRRLADAGRKRVESRYTWPAAMAMFDAIVDAALARSRRQGPRRLSRG